MRRIALGLALVVLLASCTPPMHVTETIGPPLSTKLPPAPPGPLQQILTVHYQDHEQTLQCGLDQNAERLQVDCVNPLGLRIFSLRLGAGGSLEAERGLGVPESLNPEHVLSDLQLTFWPESLLQAAYPETLWRIVNKDHIRQLWHGDKLHTEVHYADQDPWLGRFRLKSLRYGYQLDIDSSLLLPDP